MLGLYDIISSTRPAAAGQTSSEQAYLLQKFLLQAQTTSSEEKTKLEKELKEACLADGMLLSMSPMPGYVYDF